MANERGKKGGQNVTAAGVAGAVVGATVGAAAAWALADEKNRKKIKNAAHNVGGYVQDKVSLAKHQMREQQKKMDSSAAKATRKVEEVKQDVENEVKSKN